MSDVIANGLGDEVEKSISAVVGNFQESARVESNSVAESDSNEIAAQQQPASDSLIPARGRARYRCPNCVRPIERNQDQCEKCHCSIGWVEGSPCHAGTENEIKERLTILKQITKGLRDKCPKCGRPRPGTRTTSNDSVVFAIDWAAAMKKYRRCPTCHKARLSRNEEMRSKRREFFGNIAYRCLMIIGAILLMYVLISKITR